MTGQRIGVANGLLSSEVIRIITSSPYIAQQLPQECTKGHMHGAHLSNRFAHLTNHCIATEHAEYGKYEPTNEARRPPRSPAGSLPSRRLAPSHPSVAPPPSPAPALAPWEVPSGALTRSAVLLLRGGPARKHRLQIPLEHRIQVVPRVELDVLNPCEIESHGQESWGRKMAASRR